MPGCFAEEQSYFSFRVLTRLRPLGLSNTLLAKMIGSQNPFYEIEKHSLCSLLLSRLIITCFYCGGEIEALLVVSCYRTR